MSSEPNNLRILVSKYRSMSIEELKASIDYWEKVNDCSIQPQKIDLAKNELEIKYNERKEQIKLLTESLTSSSRIGRWISSVKSVFR
mgnify:CR=1 FL=1